MNQFVRKRYPIEIRDIAPGPGAVRLTANRAAGGIDGAHTGGAWLYQNKVWKPLDGRPNPTAPYHISTDEEACLTALQGKPLFPKNWEIKEANGRRFVVRDQVPVFPGGTLRLTLDQMFEIQDGILQMNRNKWEVNDDIVIGKDRSGRLFIVDLSIAQYRPSGSGAFAADDSSQFFNLAKLAGFSEIGEMHMVAISFLEQIYFNRDFKKDHPDNMKLRYIYSSEKQVKINNTVNLNQIIDKINAKEQQLARKYFWLASTTQLSAQDVRTHKLRLRHAPKSN